MVAIAMAMFIIGYTMLIEDSALLPTNLETKIQSIRVYSDIKIIIMTEGAANFKSEKGVKF